MALGKAKSVQFRQPQRMLVPEGCLPKIFLAAEVKSVLKRI